MNHWSLVQAEAHLHLGLFQDFHLTYSFTKCKTQNEKFRLQNTRYKILNRHSKYKALFTKQARLHFGRFDAPSVCWTCLPSLSPGQQNIFSHINLGNRTFLSSHLNLGNNSFLTSQLGQQNIFGKSKWGFQL